jgi:hypothetical protein
MQIPNSTESHGYIPLNSNTMRVLSFWFKYILWHICVKQYSRTTHIVYNDIPLYSYVACTYGGKWWISVGMEKSGDNSDCLVKFMHPEGPSPSIYWPQKDGICWDEMESTMQVTNTDNRDMTSVYPP